MVYLNDQNILDIGINQHLCMGHIEQSITCLHHKEYSQPVKPCLQYNDHKNRSIAMPVHFYNRRGTAEQWIKRGKYALNWTRLSCHRFVANRCGSIFSS